MLLTEGRKKKLKVIDVVRSKGYKITRQLTRLQRIGYTSDIRNLLIGITMLITMKTLVKKDFRKKIVYKQIILDDCCLYKLLFIKIQWCIRPSVLFFCARSAANALFCTRRAGNDVIVFRILFPNSCTNIIVSVMCVLIVNCSILNSANFVVLQFLRK